MEKIRFYIRGVKELIAKSHKLVRKKVHYLKVHCNRIEVFSNEFWQKMGRKFPLFICQCTLKAIDWMNSKIFQLMSQRSIYLCLMSIKCSKQSQFPSSFTFPEKLASPSANRRSCVRGRLSCWTSSRRRSTNSWDNFCPQRLSLGNSSSL